MAKATTKKNHGNARGFGVLSGTSGAHPSRTMALEDLTLLLDSTSSDSGIEVYARIVVEENLLDKATDATRKGAMRRLSELYAFEKTWGQSLGFFKNAKYNDIEFIDSRKDVAAQLVALRLCMIMELLALPMKRRGCMYMEIPFATD